MVILGGCLIIGGVWMTVGLISPGENYYSAAEEGKKDEEKPPVKGGDEAAQKVLDNMTVARKLDLTTMARLNKEEVLVLGAKEGDPDIAGHQYFDKVQQVLDALKLPYTPVTSKDLETWDFKKVAALLCNCLVTDISTKAVNNIKDFMSKGGYLFTTDWCVDTITCKVAPGYIKGIMANQSKTTLSVKPFEKNKNHIFLRDVFPKEVTKLPWLLDTGCKTFRIERPADVTALVIGPEEMKKNYRENIIAVTWTYEGGGYNPSFAGYQGDSGDYVKRRFKQGVVLHVVSHFYMQDLGLKDVNGNSSMYQLIANFLIDAKLAKLYREKGKK